MTDTLKPCPFCGAEAIITEKPRGYRVECSKRFESCPMNMRTHHHKTIDEAAEAWNTRINLLETVLTSDLVRELEKRDDVESYYAERDGSFLLQIRDFAITQLCKVGFMNPTITVRSGPVTILVIPEADA